MKKGYRSRYEKMYEIINSQEIKKYGRLPREPKNFTRDRKMPLKDVILSVLSKKGLTTSMELREYFKDKCKAETKITVQGYLQQRKKLNYKAFKYLNGEYLRDYYDSSEPKLWNGYVVLAIDGSKAEVPNSDENRKSFGKSGNQYEKSETRALVSCALDVLNHFIVDIQIDSIETSEGKLAKRNIYAVREIVKDRPLLVIFDRGYPSIELVDFLEKQGITYLFRLSSNDYKKERGDMESVDESVRLEHTHPRLQKIGKNHPEQVDHLRAKEYTDTRIIESTLVSGSQITFMTNLPRTFVKDEIQALYLKRWEIEKKYHTLKNKMKFESVTGKATLYVYQDFWAQVVVYNMIADILNAVNDFIAQKLSNRKHPLRANENIAVGLFKSVFIGIFTASSIKNRRRKLLLLYSDIQNFTVPVRNLKNSKRTHNLANRFMNNQKFAF
jgi:hypothetical protein